jgi:flagellar M-ring protein FliF
MAQGLTQLGRQLAAAWRQLGLNQRISVALAGMMVLGGLIALGLWSGRTSYGLLYGKLDEAEAAKVISALEDMKVPYQARGGGSILVPADKVPKVRMQLAGRGIPRGEGVGFEIFDKPNFGISDFVQRANFKRAVEGELARTISQLDPVESARVLIVLPENRLLVDSQRKPTASVFVRVKGSAQLPPAAVNSIRFLVANAVEGLQVNHVSVVDNQGNVLSDNEEPDTIAGLSNNQLTARRNFEQYLAKKVEGLLEKVLGPGQAVVRVSADLNWDTITRYEEKFEPEGQVARSSTINDENTETATASSGGVPGIASNAEGSSSNSVALASPPVTTNRTKKKVTTSQYEVNRSISSILQSAGGLKRLSAAVFVAQKYDGAGVDRKAVPRSPEELQKLRHLVQSALGIQETDSTRKDEIALEEMPFNDSTAGELSRQWEQQQRKQFWTELAEKLVWPAFGLGLFFLFWRAFQRVKTEPVTFGLPLGEFGGDGHGRGNGSNGEHGSPGRRAEPGLVTVDVLNQLIRENPANMTQAVRTWLTRGKPAK